MNTGAYICNKRTALSWFKSYWSDWSQQCSATELWVQSFRIVRATHGLLVKPAFMWVAKARWDQVCIVVRLSGEGTRYCVVGWVISNEAQCLVVGYTHSQLIHSSAWLMIDQMNMLLLCPTHLGKVTQWVVHITAHPDSNSRLSTQTWGWYQSSHPTLGQKA